MITTNIRSQWLVKTPKSQCSKIIQSKTIKKKQDHGDQKEHQKTGNKMEHKNISIQRKNKTTMIKTNTKPQQLKWTPYTQKHDEQNNLQTNYHWFSNPKPN